MADRAKTLQTLRQRALSFLDGMKRGGTSAIVYDVDCDGVCSAALTGRGILSMTGFTPETVPAQWGRSFELRLSAADPEFTIFLDTPAIPSRIINQTLEHGRTMVIDHHMPESYAGVEYLNPRITLPDVYLPTSYLVHNIWYDTLDETVSSWIAAVGALADHGVKHCHDLFNAVARIHPDLTGNVEVSDESLLDSSLLGKLVSLVNAAIAIRGGEGAQFACRLLLTTDHYSTLLRTETVEGHVLDTWHTAYKEEFRKVLQTLDASKVEIGEEIVLFNVNSPFRLKSALADFLPRKFEDKVVVVVQRKAQSLYVSFRKGERVDIDLARFAKQIADLIPDASGGGHPEAAAAKLSAKHYAKLVEAIRQVHTQHAR